MNDSVFIDTNVIVYAHDSSSPAKRDQARDILREGIARGSAAISTQVLGEFYVTMTQKVQKPLSSVIARREIGLLAALQVADIDVPLVDRAIEIHDTVQLSYWDSLIIAAAEKLGCTTVLSEDMSDNQTYGSVTVRNPFASVSGG